MSKLHFERNYFIICFKYKRKEMLKMDFSQNHTSYDSDYLKDPTVKTDADSTTDRKKKMSDMSNEEKKAYYDAEIEKLKEKLRKTEEKKNSIGNVTDKQRNHALILFASHFLSREQLFEWYQLKPKERDQKIREYALQVKEKAGL